MITRERFVEVLVESGITPRHARDILQSMPFAEVPFKTEDEIREFNKKFLAEYPQYREDE